MKMSSRAMMHGGWVGLFAVGLACGPTPVAESPRQTPVEARPAAASPNRSVPKVQPIPQLAAGELPPVEYGTTVVGRAVAVDQSEGFQTLLIEVPAVGLPPELVRSVDTRVFARVLGADVLSPAVLASDVDGLAPAPTQPVIRLWVRRNVPTAAGSVTAGSVTAELGNVAEKGNVAEIDVYTAAGFRDAAAAGEPREAAYEYAPGQHFRVQATLPPKLTAQPKVLAAYLQALGRRDPGHPAAWFWDRETSNGAGDFRRNERLTDEWSALMRFSTGYDSVESALVTEQKLRAPVAPAAATVPMNSLKGPELLRHEWARMLGTLGGTLPAEPLAAMVPAEFYYARARSFEAFQTLVDRVDQVVTPGLRIAERHRQRLDSSERYRLELGLPADELSRVLGPHLVHSLALAGSDPMLRQGSDLSLVLDVPASETVLNVLAVKRAQLSKQHPMNTSTWDHAGITVASHQSEDGRVRQELASFKRADGKTFVLISNSKNAVKRILDTWVGQHAALASELDFQYMLKRDAIVPEDVLVYFGDRFVAEVVGPTQRILDSRRQVAKAELAALSCGSLLFGELYGRLPSDAKELGSKSWFGAGRLRHTSGEVINYDRSAGVSSAWGTPGRLTSIIDLPVPKRVSRDEQAAYVDFAEGYQRQWGERIDPIALRVKLSSDQLDAHLRVLPVMNGGDYDEVLQWSGGGLTTRVPSLPAAAGILAIGAGSPLREFLSGNGRSFLGSKFKLDWLGEWVELGLVDDPAVAEFVMKHGELPEHPSAPARQSEFTERDVAKLPLYLALDVKSAAGASLLLTLAREMATGASPDTVLWKEYGKRGATTIMQVSVEDIHVYYALTKRRLLVALQANVLERLLDGIDDELKHPPVKVQSVGGQLAIDLAPKSGPGSLISQSALRTVAAWLVEKGVHYSDIHDPWAELLLLGSAESGRDGATYEEHAFRWLGMVPVTADDKPYILTERGIADPERGSPHAPRWPTLPIAGAPAPQVLEALLGVRAEVAVDDEPGEVGRDRSLRAQVRLRLRPSGPLPAAAK